MLGNCKPHMNSRSPTLSLFDSEALTWLSQRTGAASADIRRVAVLAGHFARRGEPLWNAILCSPLDTVLYQAVLHLHQRLVPNQWKAVPTRTDATGATVKRFRDPAVADGVAGHTDGKATQLHSMA